MTTYRELKDLSTTHICSEHPEAALVIVWDKDHPRLACGEAHWVDKLERLMLPSELDRQGIPLPVTIENTIKRRYSMSPVNKTPLSPGDRVEITEGGKTALQRKEEKQAVSAQEEKMVEPSPLTLADWYLRLRQFYPTAVVGTRPMSYDERSPAMLPSDIHAWVAEVFERPQGLMIAQGHGYAWEGEEKETGEPPAKLPWAWQKAEERAEIAAISRAVPLGLEPPRKE